MKKKEKKMHQLTADISRSAEIISNNFKESILLFNIGPSFLKMFFYNKITGRRFTYLIDSYNFENSFKENLNYKKSNNTDTCLKNIIFNQSEEKKIPVVKINLFKRKCLCKKCLEKSFLLYGLEATELRIELMELFRSYYFINWNSNWIKLLLEHMFIFFCCIKDGKIFERLLDSASVCSKMMLTKYFKKDLLEFKYSYAYFHYCCNLNAANIKIKLNKKLMKGSSNKKNHYSETKKLDVIDGFTIMSFTTEEEMNRYTSVEELYKYKLKTKKYFNKKAFANWQRFLDITTQAVPDKRITIPIEKMDYKVINHQRVKENEIISHEKSSRDFNIENKPENASLKEIINGTHENCTNNQTNPPLITNTDHFKTRARKNKLLWIQTKSNYSMKLRSGKRKCSSTRGVNSQSLNIQRDKKRFTREEIQNINTRNLRSKSQNQILNTTSSIINPKSNVIWIENSNGMNLRNRIRQPIWIQETDSNFNPIQEKESQSILSKILNSKTYDHLSPLHKTIAEFVASKSSKNVQKSSPKLEIISNEKKNLAGDNEIKKSVIQENDTFEKSANIDSVQKSNEQTNEIIDNNTTLLNDKGNNDLPFEESYLEFKDSVLKNLPIIHGCIDQNDQSQICQCRHFSLGMILNIGNGRPFSKKVMENLNKLIGNEHIINYRTAFLAASAVANNEKKLLRRIVVPVVSNSVLQADNNENTSTDKNINETLEINPEVRNLVNCLLDYVEIKNDPLEIKYDPLVSYKISNSLKERRKPFRQRMSRLKRELRRLDSTLLYKNSKKQEKPFRQEQEKDSEKLCFNEYCDKGCVCESLQCNKTDKKLHCGKAACIFSCSCPGKEIYEENFVKAEILEDISDFNKSPKKSIEDVIQCKSSNSPVNRSKRETQIPTKFNNSVLLDEPSLPSTLKNLAAKKKKSPIKKDVISSYNKNVYISPRRIDFFIDDNQHEKVLADLFVWCNIHSKYNCNCRSLVGKMKENILIWKPIENSSLKNSSNRSLRMQSDQNIPSNYQLCFYDLQQYSARTFGAPIDYSLRNLTETFLVKRKCELQNDILSSTNSHIKHNFLIYNLNENENEDLKMMPINDVNKFTTGKHIHIEREQEYENLEQILLIDVCSIDVIDLFEDEIIELDDEIDEDSDESLSDFSCSIDEVYSDVEILEQKFGKNSEDVPSDNSISPTCKKQIEKYPHVLYLPVLEYELTKLNNHPLRNNIYGPDNLPNLALYCLTPGIGYMPIVEYHQTILVIQDPIFHHVLHSFKNLASANLWLNKFLKDFLSFDSLNLNLKWVVIKPGILKMKHAQVFTTAIFDNSDIIIKRNGEIQLINKKVNDKFLTDIKKNNENKRKVESDDEDVIPLGLNKVRKLEIVFPNSQNHGVQTPSLNLDYDTKTKLSPSSLSADSLQVNSKEVDLISEVIKIEDDDDDDIITSTVSFSEKNTDQIIDNEKLKNNHMVASNMVDISKSLNNWPSSSGDLTQIVHPFSSFRNTEISYETTSHVNKRPATIIFRPPAGAQQSDDEGVLPLSSFRMRKMENFDNVDSKSYEMPSSQSFLRNRCDSDLLQIKQLCKSGTSVEEVETPVSIPPYHITVKRSIGTQVVQNFNSFTNHSNSSQPSGISNRKLTSGVTYSPKVLIHNGNSPRGRFTYDSNKTFPEIIDISNNFTDLVSENVVTSLPTKMENAEISNMDSVNYTLPCNISRRMVTPKYVTLMNEDQLNEGPSQYYPNRIFGKSVRSPQKSITIHGNTNAIATTSRTNMVQNIVSPTMVANRSNINLQEGNKSPYKRVYFDNDGDTLQNMNPVIYNHTDAVQQFQSSNKLTTSTQTNTDDYDIESTSYFVKKPQLVFPVMMLKPHSQF